MLLLRVVLSFIGVASRRKLATIAHHSQQASITLVILGVGAGATAVFDGEASSSFAILDHQARPLLLADLGLGVMRACMTHLHTNRPPRHIYISHNHTDHAGELPVVAAVARNQQRGDGASTPPTLLAHADVLPVLLQHRLHELQSTGLPVEAFVTPRALQTGEPWTLPGTLLSLEPVLAQHAERCYGLLLRWDGQPIVGWTVGGCWWTRQHGMQQPLWTHRPIRGFRKHSTRRCLIVAHRCCWLTHASQVRASMLAPTKWMRLQRAQQVGACGW